MYRSEIKFIINKYQMEIIKNNMNGVLQRDTNSSGNGSYLIRSLYFDDINDTSYKQVLDGLSKREKYRIRYYNYDSSFIRFENKIKRNNMNKKDTAKINKEDVINMINNQDFNSENELLKIFKTKIKTRLYKPKVIIDYERDAYIYKAGNVRVTFDYNLTCSYEIDKFFEKDINTIPLLEKNMIILEVKYDEFLPTFIRQLLNINNVELTSFSKYANGRKILEQIKGV